MQAPILKAGLCSVLALLCWFLPNTALKPLDNTADHYFETAITKASLAYATTRAVNASVSVVQHSQLQLEPAGIGVSLAIGQLLDPVNDMAERLSDVLVMAIVSLGVQKLAYDIAQLIALKALALIILAIALTVLCKANTQLTRYIQAMALLLVLARLLMPTSAWISHSFHTQYLVPKVEAATQIIEQHSHNVQQLDAMTDQATREQSGLWSKAKSLTEYGAWLKQSLSNMTKNVEVLISHLLEVCWLYISFFILQVLILPLLNLWVLWRCWHLFIRV